MLTACIMLGRFERKVDLGGGGGGGGVRGHAHPFRSKFQTK